MKKILALIICLIMIISACLLTGCFDDIDDSTSNATSESTSENADANKVSLLGIQASVHEGALPQSAQNSPAASLLSTYTTAPEIQTLSNAHSSDDELLENNGGYLSIFKSQTIINFTIKLNNPYDYYILDFRLGADDEEVEYYTSEKTWKSIADRDIRWMGSDNATCTYILKLSSPDATPSKIRIKWMYYTDKHNGRNRFAVNMNNKDKYTIYKFDESIKDGAITFTDIISPLDGKTPDGQPANKGCKMVLKKGVSIDRLYDCVFSYAEDKYIYTDYDIKEDGIYDDVRFRYVDYSYTERNVTIRMKKVYFMKEEDFTIRYFKEYKPEIITEETFDEETQKTKTKRYYAMEMMFGGFGCPLNSSYVVWNMAYKGNNFIYEWNWPRLLLEVPEGKDEAWCREQEFEIFGNVFNIGRLADGKYGKYAIARD